MIQPRLLIIVAVGLALGMSDPGRGHAADEPPVTVKIAVDVSEVPELADWAEKVKGMCQEWYPLICEMLPSEGFSPPEVVTINFKKDMPGIAGTSRTKIAVSARWVQDHPDDFGMVIHELTHVVQAYPKYEPVWLIEGLADYVRYYHFEPDVEHPRPDPKRSSYLDGYHTTAAFLAWIEKTHDKSIIQELNRALRASEYQDSLFQDRTGRDLDMLWQEYLQAQPDQ